MSIRTGYRTDPLPLPTETRPLTESRPEGGVGGHEGLEQRDGFEARSESLRESLRRDPTVPSHTGGDYDTILSDGGGPLASRTVTLSQERDDLLIDKLTASRGSDGDPEIERAVAMARDTAVLDHVVNEVSDGAIRNLSEQVSPKTLERVKDHVADAIRSETGPVDGPTIGKSARGDAEVTEKVGLLARVKAAVDRTIDTIRNVVSRAPINAIAKEVKAFAKARLDGVPEQQVARAMAESVGKLGNNDLLRLYRTTLSLDMVEYRMQLADRAGNDPEAGMLLENLNSYEATVHAEVIERSLQPAPELDGFQPIDHGPKLGQLGALAGTEKRAANRELAAQSDDYLSGDPWAQRTDDPGASAKVGPTGLSVGQVSDALRSADLTINVGPKLFATGGPFRDESGELRTGPRLKNIFELPQAKGPLYMERRRMVEHALEPATERADRSGVDPGNHPISAGVNVGRRVAGSAPGYGEVVLVLKDSVKERSTYTASDSFNAPFMGAQATPQKIALFKARVAELLEPGGGLSEPDRLRLAGQKDALSNVFAELDRLTVQGFPPGRGMEHYVTYDLLKDIDGRVQYQLATVAMDCFMDRSQAGSDHVTSADRMSHIVGDLNQNVVSAIATGIQDPQRINLPVNNYIEAQVYGGIDLANDVAEIRYFEKDTSTMSPEERASYQDSIQGMRMMADELGIRVVRHRPEDTQLTHI